MNFEERFVERLFSAVAHLSHNIEVPEPRSTPEALSAAWASALASKPTSQHQ